MGRLNKHPINTKQSGFTLIEILVAMAIFALIAVGSVAMLTAVSAKNDLSDQRMQSLQTMQRAMLIIERDFLQMVPRKTRLEGEVSDTLVFAGKFAFESESDGLGFVRSGWHNPQLTLRRSTLQSVAYRTQNKELQRLYSTYVDNAIGFEPKVRVLLEGIESVSFEFLEKFDKKSFEWEEAKSVDELPIAVAIVIKSEVYGEIRREFKVRR
ncbi:type II secretion system minor pseudopilin GspJ [Glaciecola sp. 33A]|jgi:general secretion pathway protein J|uniref:type II secretion system minor pseudopilin GspJ n=1 Tax=Glaciecola sp. 33A TaxID=2057807 RepID=UPI000C339ECC|nr:type II secretion system minor pseudopilin GspJ [Glaciecola sp. 33A]PKI03335.1 type II secretion system protein GspJ [Glaciecola sp. 33A]